MRVMYRCTACQRAEKLKAPHVAMGTPDDRARVRGWRLSPPPTDNTPRVKICPECSGDDPDYWDNRTLSIAYQAGIDAGNTAWGGAAHA